MSKIGVSLSLDVTKIDKARLKEVTKKDGSVAKYLNLTTFINPTEEDQYGNHGFIAQSQTKEEREAKVQRNYLGNGKVVWTNDIIKLAEKEEAVNTPAASNDLPF